MSKRFGKQDKVKGKKAVSRIFENPKSSITLFPFKAFYSISKSNKSNVRFAVSVPKKKFKRAVDRNKIKRLLREALRLHKSILDECLTKQNISLDVMVLYNSEKMPSYNSVEIKIKEILKRLCLGIQSYEEK
ncbi:MAG: ribonuclease P protein component [Flavobacteriales bacterium]|mgnify:CR=1 FL=1|nr:ribonuclease P protein component [Flavobacteriales bacterium]|tara:strand:- start:2566 stop:2961 length:396 start_codon:yes stop_codon:yes gene_type:complete